MPSRGMRSMAQQRRWLCDIDATGDRGQNVASQSYSVIDSGAAAKLVRRFCTSDRQMAYSRLPC